MRKHLSTWLVFLSVLCFLSACQDKDMYNSEYDKKVTDLIVPAGFDWKLTNDVSLNISSPVQTEVSVYLTENCVDNSLIAKLPVFEGAKPADLSVPAGTETIYVQYTTENGEKAVIPVSLISSMTRVSGNLDVKLPAGVAKSTNRETYCFYPMNGYGTLLFEDNWPGLGDYDFNDWVAHYMLTTIGDNDGVSSIDVWIQLSAMGGRFPYQLCLMLDGTETSNVAEIRRGEEIGEWELLSKDNDPIAFSFDWENLKGHFGGNYYNVEKEYMPDFSTWKKQIAYFTISFKNKIKVTDNTFNFFIKSAALGEIHLMGYKPTNEFISKYNQMVESNPSLSPDTYYKNANGFVWGLKIPKGIAHAQEGVDFCKAYKDFAGWVLSSGKEYQNWYENGVSDKLMPRLE